jgi:hypothetical protein
MHNDCTMSLSVTPAMEAGITDHVWTIAELLAQHTVPLKSQKAQPLDLADEITRTRPNGDGFTRLARPVRRGSHPRSHDDWRADLRRGLPH